MPALPNRRPEPSVDDTPQRRSILDDEGARWNVYEQSFSDYDRRSGMSLIFASESVVRRVRDYPTNWAELSDAELMELSWNS